MMVKCVERYRRKRSGYASPGGVGGFGLKTAGLMVFGFGPQNPVGVPAGTGAHGVIVKFVSRRSKVVKSAWPSYAPVSSWTIMP
jgi:hypothetical protein